MSRYPIVCRPAKKHRVDLRVSDIYIKYPFAQGVYLISALQKHKNRRRLLGHIEYDTIMRTVKPDIK